MTGLNFFPVDGGHYLVNDYQNTETKEGPVEQTTVVCTMLASASDRPRKLDRSRAVRALLFASLIIINEVGATVRTDIIGISVLGRG